MGSQVRTMPSLIHNSIKTYMLLPFFLVYFTIISSNPNFFIFSNNFFWFAFNHSFFARFTSKSIHSSLNSSSVYQGKQGTPSSRRNVFKIKETKRSGIFPFTSDSQIISRKILLYRFDNSNTDFLVFKLAR